MATTKNTMKSRMDNNRLALVALLLAALALVGWAYFGTYSSIVQKWFSDAAFSHGVLIMPISLWLAWRKRNELAASRFEPSVVGVLAVILCVLAWIVARGSGVLVIEQLAAVVLVPALVLTALGLSATRVLLVPLAFLLFMVPFGRGLVPSLMQATADFATLLLQWTGIPVLRSYMHISIPAGSFEVARACSGLNYFITSIVLGCLYAYLNYRGWVKRALCVAAFIVIPVILNGLRVYFTILVSHLTDMRFGPGVEHVTFGRIFFVVVMLGLFWIGRRWHDDTPPGASLRASATEPSTRNWTTWWPLPLATLIAMSGPAFVATSIALARAQSTDVSQLVSLPASSVQWRAPEESGSGRWRPLYRGGLVERQAVYFDSTGAPVDVFVAVYGLGGSLGAEMISYNNVVSADERGSLAKDTRREMVLSDGLKLKVRELVVADGGTPRLVWHWYVVGERPVASQLAAKALEAVAFATRGAYFERVVTISTPYDDMAAQRLRSFAASQGHCIAGGFAVEACLE
jgi:exosortase A